MKLSPAAKRLEKRYEDEYGFGDQYGRDLLTQAMKLQTRLGQLEAILETEGLVMVNRFGEARPHPALDAERKTRVAYCQVLKQLGCDVEPPNHNIGRPPGR